ncbi:hypothetical protein ON010_g7350 [Phytophthora cinnamomi]|nr:hypothetical protein ON010_g7350 [Phytophthora cinnamomi]
MATDSPSTFSPRMSSVGGYSSCSTPGHAVSLAFGVLLVNSQLAEHANTAELRLTGAVSATCTCTWINHTSNLGAHALRSPGVRAVPGQDAGPVGLPHLAMLPAASPVGRARVNHAAAHSFPNQGQVPIRGERRAGQAQLRPETLKQAALAFNGPAYQGLEAHNLSESDLEFAQAHLRILCGLYGVLRPLDLIQPYRLEMGQKFANNRGKDLYEFWGDSIVTELDALFREEEANEDEKKPRVLVNVASQEYFKSLPRDALEKAGISVVDCVFKDDGKIKSVYAKRARGLMCRYLIQKRVDSLEGITGFDLEGYKYSSAASSDETFVFTRTAAEQKAALQQTKAKASTPKAKASPKTKRAAINAEKKEPKVEEAIKDDNDKPQLRRSTRKKRKTD